MKIGYIRVSTQDQNTIRQEVLMKQLGVDQVYIDKFSGKNRNRPELQTMLEFVRKGDVVIVESISRIARNTRDLLELMDRGEPKEKILCDYISAMTDRFATAKYEEIFIPQCWHR